MRNPLLFSLLLFLTCAHTLSTANGALYHPERSWMESETVFDGQVFLRTVGNPSHPAIVLIHGLGEEASTSWNDLIERLKNNYFIFTLDLPGFGHSSKQNALYSPENYAYLIHQLTHKVVKKPFHLVGHSMGGAISLQYAHDYPAEVKTLTLVDAAGILHRLAYTKYLAPLGIDKLLSNYNYLGERKITDLAGILMSALEKRAPVDMNHMLKYAFFREKVLRGNPTMIAGLALVLNDFSRVPETIHQPTLIIWGDKDRIAPLRTGQVLDTLMPNAMLALIPDGGHMAFVEHPKPFNNLLLNHIEQKQSSNKKETDKPASTKFQQRVICRDQSSEIITGRIGRLLVENCHDLLIKDAEIDTATIINSSVTLLNTTITSPDTALIVYDSDLMITIGQIEGGTAIRTHNSRLDVAGTQLIGHQTAINAPVDSTVIFSLGRITSPNYQDSVIHGMKVFMSGEKL